MGVLNPLMGGKGKVCYVYWWMGRSIPIHGDWGSQSGTWKWICQTCAVVTPTCRLPEFYVHYVIAET